MRDHIDLQSTAQRAEEQKRRRPGRGLLGLLGVAVLLTLGVFVAFQAVLYQGNSTLLQLTSAGTWQQVASLPGSPDEIQTSVQDVIWVSTAFHGGISRFDGQTWRSYTGADFGLEENYLWGGFALAGEEVWGATQSAVIHFAGQHWNKDPRALITHTPSDIVADRSGVWLIDRLGNLLHFDGSHWTSINLSTELPRVQWSDRKYPSLALTPDGALWLAQDGVWQFDGHQWREVRLPESALTEAAFVGVTPDRIWLWWHEELIGITFDRQIVQRYNTTDLHLPADAVVYQVAQDAGQLQAVANTARLTLNADQWQATPFTPPAGYRLMRVAFGPAGQTWAIGMQQNALIRNLVILGLSLIVGVVILGWSFFSLGRGLKRMSQDRTRIGELVVQSVPGTPPVPPVTKFSAGKALLLFIAFLIATTIIVAVLNPLIESGVSRIWPAAPSWLPTVVLLAGLVLVINTAVYLIGRAKKQPNQPSWGHSLLRGLGNLALWGLFFFGIQWLFSSLSGLSKNPLVVLLLALPIILIGFPAIFVAAPFAPIYWVQRALRQADYATALKRTAQLQRWRGKTAEVLFIEGTIQLFAGQLDQAEARLRDSLSEGQRRGGLFEQSVALENLGYVLMEQRRYAEALPVFESSLNIKPNRGDPYNCLGELYLRQGREPQRALELIERALQYKRATRSSRFADRYMLGEMWANRAWALALLNRERESTEAIASGLRETDPKFKPALAGLYWRAGQARLFLNDRSAATEYWRNAQQIDPNGLYGQLATQALHDLDQGEN